jgi:hypothetical protein
MGPCSKSAKRIVRVFARDKDGKGRVEDKTVPFYDPKHADSPTLKLDGAKAGRKAPAPNEIIRTEPPARAKPPTEKAKTAPKPVAPPSAIELAEHEEAIRRRSLRRLEALAWLQTTFPLVFDPRRPKPLMLGVGAEIRREIQTRPAPLSSAKHANDALHAALKRHCASKGYLLALARDGATRFNLAGEPVEAVSDEHRALASQMLTEIARENRLRRLQADRKAAE